MGPWQCIDCKTCCLCLDAGDPDDLLFCDACDKGYHMFCHDPALQSKPVSKCMTDVSFAHCRQQSLNAQTSLAVIR